MLEKIPSMIVQRLDLVRGLLLSVTLSWQKKGSFPDESKFIKQIISTTLKLFLWKLLDWFSQDAMQTILSSVRLSSLDVRKSGYDVNPSAMWYMFLCMSYTNLREFESVLLVYSIYGTLIKWTSWVVKIVTWIQKYWYWLMPSQEERRIKITWF